MTPVGCVTFCCDCCLRSGPWPFHLLPNSFLPFLGIELVAFNLIFTLGWLSSRLINGQTHPFEIHTDYVTVTVGKCDQKNSLPWIAMFFLSFFLCVTCWFNKSFSKQWILFLKQQHKTLIWLPKLVEWSMSWTRR